MGVIYMPEPEQEPQRPTAPATDYPLGTRWMSDDSTVWEAEWDDQDKRHMWTLVSVPREASTVPRAEVVTTGQPEVDLIACIQCGVLLWNIDSHYAHAHPNRPIGLEGE